MNVEGYLNLDYGDLKRSIRFLKQNQDTGYEKLLKDTRIKQKLIDSPSKYDFIWFTQEEEDRTLLLLLDEEGIAILNSSSDLIDKLNAILTCGKEYVNDLLKKPSFCEIVLANREELAHYFSSLSLEGAKSLIEYARKKELKDSDIKKIIQSLSGKTMGALIEQIEIPFSMAEDMLQVGSKEAIEAILKQDLRISLSQVPFSTIYSMAKKGVKIPSSLLEETSLQKKISTMSNVKEYRFLIEALKQNNDTSDLEKKRKQYYEDFIANFNSKENMSTFHYTLYEKVVKLLEQKKNMEEMILSLPEVFNAFGSGLSDIDAQVELGRLYREKDIQKIHRFFEQESNLLLTNMIVDFHFEDIPYNLFLDLKQLCHFQKTGVETLSEEELSFYQKILDLDSLSYDEKITLHQELSKTDMISKYYDDYRSAKEKSYQLIKEKMLTDKTAKKWKDEELSLKAGVDIYVLEGDPFYAFIKSLCISKTQVMEKKDILYTVDGCSYSLDGSDKLNTYYNPHEYYNIAYNDFPSDQVLHMYPVDSFSKYIREFHTGATDRVYQLMTPEELVKKSYQYNEIVMLQRNDRRVDDDFNDRLKVPSMFAIYCYDEITNNDILSAKNLGLSIILVKTKNYRKQIETIEDRMSMFDTTGVAYG